MITWFLQAIARTNRIAEGKDYGLIVDYRGLIEKLDDAMEMYSGAGLENFDSGDLKGVIVDVISAVGSLREANSNLESVFSGIKNKDDSEEYEVALADEKTRERELSALDTIKDHYPKYLITLDYDKATYNGIKQISAIDFLLGREDI